MKKQISLIVNAIEKHLNDTLSIKKITLNKKTARARAKALLKNSNGNLHILEIARDNTEEFYLTRTIEIPLKISGQNFLQASFFSFHENYKYALFPVISNAQHFYNELPTKILKQIQGKKDNVKLDNYQRSLVINGFLSAWPNEIHAHICKMNLFEEFVEQLQKIEKAVICNEHGDLSPNNILHHKELTIIDFEFFKPYQIAGFDIFYNRKIRGLSLEKNNEVIYKLNELKLKLISSINKAFDFELTNIIFHTRGNVEIVFINGESLGKKEIFLETPKTDQQIKLFIDKLIKYDVKVNDLFICEENIPSVKKYANFKNILTVKIGVFGYPKTIKKLIFRKILFFSISTHKDLGRLLLKHKLPFSS